MLAKTSRLSLYDLGLLTWQDEILPRPVQNLLFLEQDTLAWMREHLERVDLDLYLSVCGTWGCLAGFYEARRYAEPDRDRFFSREGLGGEFLVEPSSVDLVLLFGSASSGTLEQRATRLRSLIRDRLADLDKAEQGEQGERA